MDNERKRGKQDRIRAARTEDYESRYVARKFRLNIALVRAVIARVGNLSGRVYAELRKLSRPMKAAGAKKGESGNAGAIRHPSIRAASSRRLLALSAHLQISDTAPNRRCLRFLMWGVAGAGFGGA